MIGVVQAGMKVAGVEAGGIVCVDDRVSRPRDGFGLVAGGGCRVLVAEAEAERKEESGVNLPALEDAGAEW